MIARSRSDGKPFDDPLRELGTRQLVLIERKTFETWAGVDQKIPLPPSMSTREIKSLRRQPGALALQLLEHNPRFRKDDGMPSVNAIAEAVVALLNRRDTQRAVQGLARINAAGVWNSPLRQQATEGLKALES